MPLKQRSASGRGMGLGSISDFMRLTWIKGAKETKEKAPKRCNHQRVDRSLWVDCAGCQGAQDLGNDECRTAVIDVLSREWAVDEIVLSRDSDVLYSSDCAEVLSRIAGIVRLCREMSASGPTRPECGECRLNPKTVLSSMEDRVLSHPMDLSVDLHLTIPKRDAGCRVCSERLESCVEQVRKELGAIRRTVTRMVFHVTEEDGDSTTRSQT